MLSAGTCTAAKTTCGKKYPANRIPYYWPHCQAGQDPVCAGAAQNEERKDHAAHFAKIAEGESSNFGDITTLLDPGVVEEIAKGKL
jgi:hypothetical protein